MSEIKDALRKLRENRAARDAAAQHINQSFEDCEAALRKEGIRVYASVTMRKHEIDGGRHIVGEDGLAWSRESGSWRLVIASEDYTNPDAYEEVLLVDAPLRDREAAGKRLPELLEKLVQAVERQAKGLLDASEVVDAVTATILDGDEAE